MSKQILLIQAGRREGVGTSAGGMSRGVFTGIVIIVVVLLIVMALFRYVPRR
jgi:hypothetical protein